MIEKLANVQFEAASQMCAATVLLPTTSETLEVVEVAFTTQSGGPPPT